MLVLLLALACTKADTDSDGADDTDVAQDADGDGFLAPEDCDDHDAGVHPGATETCDAVDQDCDGSVDEDAVDVRTFYVDADHDTYGDVGSAVVACDKATGEVEDATDCDDADGDVHPGASEVCNGVDDDCNGSVDDGVIDAATLYVDADGDGYGTTEVVACPGAGLASLSGDCDDADASVSPGVAEVCDDHVDDDCDPSTICRLTGDIADPITEATADAAFTWPSGSAPQLTWGAWGDLDGDGYDDAIVSYSNNHGDPQVSVVWGSATVASAALGATTFEDPTATVLYAVVDAGDVDGDGFEDLLAATGSEAWLLFGAAARPGSGSLGTLAVGLSGDVEDAAFVGDLDGDGFGDWAAEDTTAGTTWLVYGAGTRPTGGALADAAAGGLLGVTNDGVGVTDGGDFDGDGLSELVVCGWDTDLGLFTANLVYGDVARRSGTWTVDDVDARFATTDQIGYDTFCDPSDVGDVDGDGLDDFGVAAGGDTSIWAGTTTRWSGDRDTTSATSTYTGQPFEQDSRVTGGDLDADGFSDLAIGLARSSDKASVRVFYGSSSPWGAYDVRADSDASIYGSDGVAIAIDAAGDVDRDGYADLLGVEKGSLDGAWVFLGAGD